MKVLFRSSVLIALLLAAMLPAQAGIILNFDENGNGWINLGAGFVLDQGTLQTDPTGRVSGGVLIYSLDPLQLVNNGDVPIWEDGSMTVLSDVLTFTDINGNLTGTTADRMIFYSDLGDSDLADVGLPGVTLTGGTVENGVEGGFRDFTWNPTAGFTYNGISDSPEPASFLLLGTGLLLFGMARRKNER